MPTLGTVNLPFTLGADQPPDGTPPELARIFSEVYNYLRQIRATFHDYVGIGQQQQALWNQLQYFQTLHQHSPWRLYLPATEALSYGHAINIFDNAGVLSVRFANATNNTRPCHGFCTTTTGIGVGAYGEVILMQGLLTGVAGLTRGTRYFLSTVNGLLTAVAPVAAGNIEQAVGLALDPTALLYCTDFDFIQH